MFFDESEAADKYGSTLFFFDDILVNFTVSSLEVKQRNRQMIEALKYDIICKTVLQKCYNILLT